MIFILCDIAMYTYIGFESSKFSWFKTPNKQYNYTDFVGYSKYSVLADFLYLPFYLSTQLQAFVELITLAQA